MGNKSMARTGRGKSTQVKKDKPKALLVTTAELHLLSEVLNTSLDPTLEWNSVLEATKPAGEYAGMMRVLNRLNQKVQDALEDKGTDVTSLRHAASVLDEVADETAADEAVTYRTAAEMLETKADLRGAC